MGDSPLIAAAIHHGHAIRDELYDWLYIDEATRLREEDPFTGDWTTIADNRIVAHQSRFEFDINRPPEKAIYIQPEDAWGLRIWKAPPPPSILATSRARYKTFYQEARRYFSQIAEQKGKFIVFDLHTYNHRRNGPDQPPADQTQNPDVNIGTGSLNREKWGAIVDRFISDLKAADYPGRKLDVRENVKFRGGYFSRWLHETFPDSACVLSIEFKKFFMDEWNGEADLLQLEAIRESLRATIPGVLEELAQL